MRNPLAALGALLVLSALLALTACPPPHTAAPPPTPGIAPGTGATPGEGVTPTPVATPVAVGGACTVDADCDSNICEGQGCGDTQGICADRNRACTRDLATYCGCDGQVFQSSGSCPGRRFASRGPCTDAPSSARTNLADGAACSAASECTSGVCEGMGCGELAGICKSKNRACTMDIRQYCGCDGVTFQGSGSCPGRLYAKAGACETK